MAVINLSVGRGDNITLSGTAYTVQEVRVHGSGFVDVYAGSADVLYDRVSDDGDDNTSVEGRTIPAGQRLRLQIRPESGDHYMKLALWSATASATTQVDVVG